MNKSKITLINIISNIILQFATIVSGFIIPKIILSYFGSSVNGLVASLNQFLSYISLIEGGITGVITASLYKPLIDKEYDKISSILKTTKSFYNKIALIYIIYAISLAIIYPLVIKTDFSYFYIFCLTIILSMNLLIQYLFSLTLQVLLNADKKIYVVAFTKVVIIFLNIILAYVSVKIYPSIHLLKFLTGILFIIQPFLYMKYVKKNYRLSNEVEENKELIKNRWNGFAINVAAFIHFSTDLTILTALTDLVTVSIYSVYSLVSNGLRQIISSITSSLNYSLGQTYAKGNRKEIYKKMELYEFIVFNIIFILFSVAALLINSFVMIYTNNIDDANYNNPIFGVLLLVSEAIYLLKLPHLNLAYSANKFKEITIPAYIEAILNILVSIICVKKLGIIGVVIGTIVAMIYRMIFHIYFTKKIIGRSQRIFYKKLILFSFSSLIGIIICRKCCTGIKFSIFSWILHAIIYSIIILLIFISLDYIFYKDDIKDIINYIFK